MTAKEFLKRIKKIDTLIKNKKIEQKKREEVGLSTHDLGELIEKLKKEQDEKISVLEKLSEEEYDVLHRVYVQGATLYEVAADRKTSYSLATTIHGRALKHLERMINTAK